MKTALKSFRLPPGKALHLKEWATLSAPVYSSEKECAELLAVCLGKLSSLQKLLYAYDRYALLLIFQGMDAAGKDGAISHILSGVDPQGCDVHSFRAPSAEELDHDFLWRTTCRLPARGRIGVFNRSYYEEVLVAKVHASVLERQRIPGARAGDPRFWVGRYRSMVDLERHLYRNGTRTVKIFLHLSKGEQRRRFLDRIDGPDKSWKFSRADAAERRFWKPYQRAYEECLEATGTRHAPWHVVPADDKSNARLIISRILIGALEDLRMEMPALTPGRREELKAMRRELSS